MANNSTLHKNSDLRNHFLRILLEEEKLPVQFAAELLNCDIEVNEISNNDKKIILLLPVPVSKDFLEQLKPCISRKHLVIGGNLPEDFRKFCSSNNICCIDYFDSPELAMQNTVATAEGAICEAISNSPLILSGSKVCVFGFGKCGEILSDRLHGLHCDVAVSSTSPKNRSRAWAYGYQLIEKSDDFSKFSFIFNTAPATVITEEIIKTLSPDVTIIDIASSPGGTDFDACRRHKIFAKLCPGLPGNFSPKTSAKLIYDYLGKIK